MDLLKELVEEAEQEEQELKRLYDEMNEETINPIRFRKLERQVDIQNTKFMKSLHEIKKCLKSIKNYYEYL